MAEEVKPETDEILEEIETSLEKIEPGYLMTIYPNGIVEIATGELARSATRRANPHYSCCCCCG